MSEARSCSASISPRRFAGDLRCELQRAVLDASDANCGDDAPVASARHRLVDEAAVLAEHRWP
jgi:hypothetical protein